VIMSIWDDISNWMTGGGRGDMQKYYKQGQGYLSPYQQGGTNAFNDWRSYTGNMGNMLSQYGNPADYRWKQINQSPMDYYKNIMNSYSESPEAKYNQEQAQRGGNAAAAASGMMGSGAYASGIQQNANDISQRDRQQYYGNVMGANEAQLQDLQNFQGRQDAYARQLQGQAGMGLNAAGQMSGNAMDMGKGMAGLDQQSLMNLLSLLGMGTGYFRGGRGGQGGGSNSFEAEPFMDEHGFPQGGGDGSLVY
jgi:hypothetical protein